VLSAAAKPILATGLTDSKPRTESVDVQGRTSDIAVLTRRLAAQDELAFREFHRVYFDRLYRFHLLVARGREQEARDALQETLLRVIRYARVFESEEAFWDWLKVLARSAARDAGRKQQRYIALLERFRLIQTERESRVEADAPENMGSVLEEVLARLSDEDRRRASGF
jgi:DNA-directed RNA polymerase specialized sigma24 family protein